MNGLYYITDAKLFSVQQLLNNMIKILSFIKNANSNINMSSISGDSQETVRMAIIPLWRPAPAPCGISFYAEIFY